jgi:lipopolysaccharide export LptBFGC system permease protein LptF
MTTRTFSLRVIMIMALSVASFVVIAATGGKKTRAAITKKTSSTYHNFSLRSGFEFKGSKILNRSNNNKQVQFNSLALIKKDKVTYSIPYKVTVKDNQSRSYNNVEIKVINIRL